MKKILFLIIFCQIMGYYSVGLSQSSKTSKIRYALKQPKHCKQKARYVVALESGKNKVRGKKENPFTQPAKKAPIKK